MANRIWIHSRSGTEYGKEWLRRKFGFFKTMEDQRWSPNLISRKHEYGIVIRGVRLSVHWKEDYWPAAVYKDFHWSMRQYCMERGLVILWHDDGILREYFPARLTAQFES